LFPNREAGSEWRWRFETKENTEMWLNPRRRISKTNPIFDIELLKLNNKPRIYFGFVWVCSGPSSPMQANYSPESIFTDTP
jgi:hypothetical protein